MWETDELSGTLASPFCATRDSNLREAPCEALLPRSTGHQAGCHVRYPGENGLTGSLAQAKLTDCVQRREAGPA